MSNGNSDLTFRALPVLPFPSPKNRCEAHKLPYIGGKGGPSQSLKPPIFIHAEGELRRVNYFCRSRQLFLPVAAKVN
jgi:hypothetical protein